MTTTTDRRIEYMPLAALEGAPVNPKAHDLDALGSSIDRFGYVEPVVVDERTGRLVAGHGRMTHLRTLEADGKQPPEGVRIGADGVWAVPVLRGWRSKDDVEAEGYLLAANRITELGGWNNIELLDMLDGLAAPTQAAAGFDQRFIDDLKATIEEASKFVFDDQSSYGTGDRTGKNPGLDGRQEKYSGKEVRSVVLDYRIEDYEEFVVMAARGRVRHGVESTAEVLIKLLRADHLAAQG